MKQVMYLTEAAIFTVLIPFFFISVFFFSPKINLTSLDFNSVAFFVLPLLFLAATLGVNELLEWLY